MKICLTLVLLCFLFAAGGWAEPRESAPVSVPSQALPAPPPRLSHVNIQGAFDPQLQSYTYLRTIGASIDEARDKHDATALAMASLLLFQAQKSSGRKSPDVDAQSLLEEATKLAEAQKNPDAMTVCARIWGDDAIGPQDAARAATCQEEAKGYAAASSAAKPAACRLTIRNRSPHTVNLYADNKFLGTIDPDDTRYIYVEGGPTDLYARATCHDVEWGPFHYVLGRDFTWRLDN